LWYLLSPGLTLFPGVEARELAAVAQQISPVAAAQQISPVAVA